MNETHRIASISQIGASVSTILPMQLFQFTQVLHMKESRLGVGEELVQADGDVITSDGG